MLALSGNSKRQRRPNVRLGDIGEVSAAFACGFSQKTQINLGHKRWKHDFVNLKESEYNHISEFSQEMLSEFTISDPGVSPRISTEMQRNRENKNRTKSISNLAGSDENAEKKSKLDFETLPQKCRLMRGKRSTRGKRVFGGPWKSKIGPNFNSKGGFALNNCSNHYLGNGIYDFSDRDTSAMNKEACENELDEPIFHIQKGGNSNELDEPIFHIQNGGSSNEFWKEGSCHEGKNVLSQSYSRDDNTKVNCSDVNSVGRWLEELGFGKYASVFEMHEVDEEALRLLTFEDLKEMGVLAVGHRRKLFAAIQQLRED